MQSVVRTGILELLNGIVPPDGNLSQECWNNTPDRYVKAMEEMLSGYKQNPNELIKTFPSGMENWTRLAEGISDGLIHPIIVTGIPFVSVCEHHLLPFYGTGHIAYIPNDKVLGLSKLPRILEMYAKRLQIQERIGQQVCDLIVHSCFPAAACYLEATHQCIACRGVEMPSVTMTTISAQGTVDLVKFIKEELIRTVQMFRDYPSTWCRVPGKQYWNVSELKDENNDQSETPVVPPQG